MKLIQDENRQVPDPYTGGQRGFEEVYDMLELASDEFLEQLSRKGLYISDSQ